MESTRAIIEGSSFLLQFQKDALITVLEKGEMIGETAIDKRVAYLNFLNEVFLRLLGKGIEDTLSVLENREVDYVLNDIVGEIDD